MSSKTEQKMEELKGLLEEAREKGDPAAEASALYGMGRIYAAEEVFDAAEELFADCASVCRSRGLDKELAQTLLDLGGLAAAKNDPDRARECWRESLEISAALQLASGQAAALDKLGELAVEQGDQENALDFFRRGREICREGGDNIGRLYFLERMAPVQRARSDWEGAEKTLRELIGLAEKFGDRERMALALVNLGDLTARRDGPGEAVPYLQMAHDIYMRIGRDGEAGVIRSQLKAMGVEPPPEREAGPDRG